MTVQTMRGNKDIPAALNLQRVLAWVSPVSHRDKWEVLGRGQCSLRHSGGRPRLDDIACSTED